MNAREIKGDDGLGRNQSEMQLSPLEVFIYTSSLSIYLFLFPATSIPESDVGCQHVYIALGNIFLLFDLLAGEE